ncbi:MAG: D-aminoacylase [Thermoleophilia bacterium]|jgi:dihydroorotase/N-acyl-D-amino-acid deacylase|nr:D-aminoacylase [Thermoleophilia bacterium]
MLDLLIRDALVVDGGGGPPFTASVAVAGGRIVSVQRGPEERHRTGGRETAREDAGAVGREITSDDVGGAQAARVVHAPGLVLAPGFIDVHTHSDLAPFTDPWMDSALRQGVTTVVVGNCGGSVWPEAGLDGLAAMQQTAVADLGGGWATLDEYLVAIDAARPACNVATLVGFGNLRAEVMGLERRPAAAGEVAAMRSLLRAGLEAGAFGLSTGLIYVPDMYADTGEVAAVAAELARHGGLYTSHMRAEGRLLFEAVRETIAIGRAAGVRPHISHLKLEGGHAWGRADELLALLDEGGASADQYPYTAWETDLSSFLPPWAPVGRLAELLADPATKARLVAAVEEGEEGWESSVSGSGWGRIVVETGPEELAGLDLAAIAAARGAQPVEVALGLLLDHPSVVVSGHTMREDDVRTILARPDILVGSDGSAVSPEGPLARTLLHPRSYGTFPRVLGRYVREHPVLTLEAAVRKMTALPAQTFGLEGRGVLTEGAAADLVLFDPAGIEDEATFAHPHVYPNGIDLVVVNGHVAWDADRADGPQQGRVERAGRALRRGGAEAEAV